MSTQEIAHRFFYDEQSCPNNSRVRTSFSSWVYMREKGIIRTYTSYSTTVAARRYDKHKNEVLVISDCKYSMTTSRHLSELESACPHRRIYYVPNCEHLSQMDYVFEREFDNLKSVSPNYFSRKENRQQVKHLIYMFDKYEKDIEHLPKAAKLRKSKFITNIINILDKDRKSINNFISYFETEKRLQEERERKAKLIKYKKDIANVERMLSQLSMKNDYEKITFLFRDSYRSGLSEAEKKALCTYRDHMIYQDIQFSYVWEDNGRIRTSLCMSVNEDVVKRLLTRFVRNEKIIGEKCEGYTILKHTSDFIKVGCHNIPIWNVKALCEHFKITA